MKDDEREFLKMVVAEYIADKAKPETTQASFMVDRLRRLVPSRNHNNEPPPAWRVMKMADCPVHVNRAEYILEKWSDNGYWEYGVSLRTGQFTKKGIEWVESTLGVKM